jgi:hypothetical protein
LKPAISTELQCALQELGCSITNIKTNPPTVGYAVGGFLNLKSKNKNGKSVDILKIALYNKP